jgi:cell filamentation protein, protein adenylyltransferase
VHTETRLVNGRRKYYLAHSYRVNSKVRKVRVFLGMDLSQEEVSRLAKAARSKLEAKIQSAKRIGDAYRTVLSSQEIKEIDLLTTKVEIKLAHLSEEDWKNFTEEFTYDTNAIEGSTVSKKEVKQVLADRQWPPKSKEEISETLGVAEAVRYVRETKDTVSLELIKELHRIVFKNSKPFAGETRLKSGVEVSVVDSQGRIVHQGAPSKEVDALLRRLARWYDDNAKEYPPLVLAAVVHNQFETIHPFQDGNGRVGRLLLINVLIKHGLPPLNIELGNRKEYYEALKEYQTNGNLRPTLDLMLREYRRLKAILKR